MSVAAPARTRHTVVAAPEPEWSPWARPPRRRWRGRLGIQSKLLAMLLAVSVLSVLVTGFFGYRSGSQALVDAEYEQLTSVRDARTRENALFSVLRRSVLLNSANATSTQSMTAFTAAFRELENETVTPVHQAAVDRYYETVFIPQLAKNVEGDVAAASFTPTSTAQRYLQAKYTAPPADPEAGIRVDDAGEGSRWSTAPARVPRLVIRVGQFLQHLDGDDQGLHLRERDAKSSNRPARCRGRCATSPRASWRGSSVGSSTGGARPSTTPWPNWPHDGSHFNWCQR
jgi:hypothetical protein